MHHAKSCNQEASNTTGSTMTCCNHLQLGFFVVVYLFVVAFLWVFFFLLSDTISQ